MRTLLRTSNKHNESTISDEEFSTLIPAGACVCAVVVQPSVDSKMFFFSNETLHVMRLNASFNLAHTIQDYTEYLCFLYQDSLQRIVLGLFDYISCNPLACAQKIFSICSTRTLGCFGDATVNTLRRQGQSVTRRTVCW